MPAIARWRSLELDSDPGRYPFMIGVPYFSHLSHQISPVDDRLGGLAAGENQFNLGRAFVNETEQLVQLQEFQVDGNVHLVKYNDVERTLVQRMSRSN